MANDCPEMEELAAFADGVLAPAEQSRVEAHLVRCARCLDVVSFAIKAKSVVPRPPASAPRKP